MPVAPYKLVMPCGRPAPVIAHVPHTSTFIPERVRHDIVLDDVSLQREVVRLTDWHVDHLFSWVLGLGGLLFVNTVSRLVFDPERLVDDALEPMAAVGQGVVYTRTTDGRTLANVSDGERARRIEHLYVPYHEGFDAAVASLLEQFGTAIILDCHSFPTVPLPSESDQTPDRPDICIGTDAVHTPAELADALEGAVSADGLTVRRNSPFAGTIVPLRYLGSDVRVSSVMVEVRRGLYCDESTGERTTDFDSVSAMLERSVGSSIAAAIKAP